jgi:two-component system sensor histidine kinase BarA
MSYRALKRLLGETSLERKCRFLFGTGIFVLITLSFLLYAYQTEHLAYEQATKTCRLLVAPVLAQHHLARLQGKLDKVPEATPPLAGKINSVLLIEPDKEYQYHFLTETFDESYDSYERELFKEFQRGEGKIEDSRLRSSEQVLLYYAPIHVKSDCLSCHQTMAKNRSRGSLAENDLIAMLRIRMPTKTIEEGLHWNRAILITTAFGTAVLIMLGSWIIVRYIIVKPVKHLKEVSDAISQGELNVRSEIQTGDEFEDLSHAFNRMLRNLVSMQDQWRKVNADLDHKVDQLAQANMALFQSNQLKSDFMSTMSHELRTPLHSIIGFSEVLSVGDNLNDKQKRWAGNILISGKQLLNLINDILDLAKMEAGKMRVRLEDFSMQDVCEGLLNMTRPLAEKKNIDLRSQIDSGIPILHLDVTKFQQIVQNLLSNAIKFTPEGGRIVLKAETEGRFVVMHVIDTGVGIAKEEQDLVFLKFRQSGSTLTREYAGTGLGLSIVRELCRLLGGEVSLQSELGRGSVFTVRLPLRLEEEPRIDFDLNGDRAEPPLPPDARVPAMLSEMRPREAALPGRRDLLAPPGERSP